MSRRRALRHAVSAVVLERLEGRQYLSFESKGGVAPPDPCDTCPCVAGPGQGPGAGPGGSPGTGTGPGTGQRPSVGGGSILWTAQGGPPVQPAYPAGSAPSTFTAAPVRFFDGTIKVGVTDIVSQAFGMPLAQTRTWTNQVQSAGLRLFHPVTDRENGNNWNLSGLPFLSDDYSADGNHDRIILVNSGTDMRFFDKVSGTTEYDELYVQNDRVIE